jgi:hypothetical protein
MVSTDDLMQALQGLSPEQLSAILAQGHARSPIKPRQLHDLRLAPTATDPRPLFTSGVPEAPRDRPETHSPYPRLLWHRETGQEITVGSAEDHARRGADWTDQPPQSQAIDPVEQARALFESLSEEDRALVLELQRKAKIDAINAALGQLSPGQMASALGQPVDVKPKARKSA